MILFQDLEGCEVISYIDKLWQPSDPAILAHIGVEWERMEEQNSASGGHLFNGPQVQANNMAVADNILELALQRIDYKTHCTTRDNPKIPEEQRGLALAVIVHLITADDYFVYGRTVTSEGQYQGIINVLAGGVDIEDIGIGEGLEPTLFRELREETGQTPRSVISAKPSYVLRERQQAHPSVVYEVESDLRRRDMEALFQGHLGSLREQNKKPEIGALHFVHRDREAIITSLEDRTLPYQERAAITLRFALQRL